MESADNVPPFAGHKPMSVEIRVISQQPPGGRCTLFAGPALGLFGSGGSITATLRDVATVLTMSSLLAVANLAAARPLEAGVQHHTPEQVMRCEPSAQAVPLPALRIEVCEDCNLSHEEVSAMERGYAVAAHAAGYRVDPFATERVRIIETGALANGTSYVKGEIAGMWFRVGDPDPGETLGGVAGRITFVILSGTRKKTIEGNQNEIRHRDQLE